MVCGFKGLYYACELVHFHSPTLYFYLPRYLLLLCGHLIYFNCSLDELQVNYNNDRSRWFSQLQAFLFFFFLEGSHALLLSSYMLLLFIEHLTGTSRTQICLQSRKADLLKYVGCKSLFILQINYFSSHLLQPVNSSLDPLWNSLDMAMQEACILFKVQVRGLVANLWSCTSGFGLSVNLHYFLLFTNVYFFSQLDFLRWVLFRSIWSFGFSLLMHSWICVEATVMLHLWRVASAMSNDLILLMHLF